jgi:hypothetical protein
MSRIVIVIFTAHCHNPINLIKPLSLLCASCCVRLLDDGPKNMKYVGILVPIKKR